MNFFTKTVAAALIVGGALSLAGPADAVPLSASLSLRDAAPSPVQTVQWRRGWGWGGVGVGLAAGAIIGGAIAASTYGYGYGYPAYGYGYGYPAYGYGYYGGYPAYGYGYYGGYAPAYYGYPGLRYRAVRRAYRRW